VYSYVGVQGQYALPRAICVFGARMTEPEVSLSEAAGPIGDLQPAFHGGLTE